MRSKFGKYKILDVLGQGGMGVIYCAVQPLVSGATREVALKVIDLKKAENEEYARALFLDEARIVAVLEHRNGAGTCTGICE